MSNVFASLGLQTSYKDRKYAGSDEDWKREMDASTTLYVGNLAFVTTEEQIHFLFAKCGEVKRIIMGLDKHKKSPCGFCFVEYYNRDDAIDCVKFISGTKLDDRVIRADIDPGFIDGRQFGRGKSGGQVRDEHRDDYDEGRGGWSASGASDKRRDEEREYNQKQAYDSLNHIPDGSNSNYNFTSGYVNKDITKRDREDDEDNDETLNAKNARFERGGDEKEEDE